MDVTDRISQDPPANGAEAAPSGGVPSQSFSSQSINQLQTELKDSGIEGSGDGAEVAGAEIGADAAVLARASELGVVKGVETLSAEFDVAAAIFVDRELLEQRSPKCFVFCWSELGGVL